MSITVPILSIEKWQRVNGPGKRLPDLDYTPEQMFWISAAHQHCDKFLDPRLLNWINDPGTIHTPAYHRVKVNDHDEFLNLKIDIECVFP